MGVTDCNVTSEPRRYTVSAVSPRLSSERDLQISRRAVLPAEPVHGPLISLGLGHEPALAVRLACLHPPPPGCTGLWSYPARISRAHAWCGVRRLSAYDPRCTLTCVRYVRRMRPVRSPVRSCPAVRPRPPCRPHGSPARSPLAPHAPRPTRRVHATCA